MKGREIEIKQNTQTHWTLWRKRLEAKSNPINKVQYMAQIQQNNMKNILKYGKNIIKRL